MEEVKGKFIGTGRIQGNCTHLVTSGWLPVILEGLVAERCLAPQVEVYSLSKTMLPMIDALEGYDPKNHDDSWYKRVTKQVLMEDDSILEADVYVMYPGDLDNFEVIQDGVY